MPDEGTIHQVTQEPLVEQPDVPAGTHTWELSWSRRKAVMRLRVVQCVHETCKVNQNEWYFKKMTGDWKNLRGQKDSGRFLFDARAQLEHKDGHPHLHLWEPIW